MTTAAMRILESFERLPDTEKRDLASEIFRRLGQADGIPLPSYGEPAVTADSVGDSTVRIVRKGRLSIAVAPESLPPLTENEVLRIRNELRESRLEI